MAGPRRDYGGMAIPSGQKKDKGNTKRRKGGEK